MAVSLGWGILFATGTLNVWDACVLLVLHGMAGSLWAPPEQLLLEDFVIGVYGVGANGMRIGSGLTVGLFGAAVGLRPALGWSAAAPVRLRGHPGGLPRRRRPPRRRRRSRAVRES